MSPAASATSQKLFKNSSIQWAIGSWSLFIAENFLLSENRPILLSPQFLNGNEDYYHYLYGLCSTAALGSIAYGYQYKIKNQGPMLWKVGQAVPWSGRIMALACMSLGFGLVSQTAPKLQIPLEYVGCGAGAAGAGGKMKLVAVKDKEVQQQASDVSSSNNNSNTSSDRRWKVRCPFDFTDSKSKCVQSMNQQQQSGEMQVHGIDRITRHPGLWGFGLVGMGLSFLSPSVPTRIWLSMPIMVALIGGEHTDSRHRRGMGGYLSPELDGQTSNVPFWAMVSGKQGKDVLDVFGKFLGGEEIKGWNALLAFGLAASVVVRKGRGGVSMGSGGKVKMPVA